MFQSNFQGRFRIEKRVSGNQWGKGHENYEQFIEATPQQNVKSFIPKERKKGIRNTTILDTNLLL